MQTRQELYPDYHTIKHTIGRQYDGVRLDTFLKTHYSHRSRQQIQKTIAEGRVSIKRQAPVGRPKPSTHLLSGDEIEILTQRKAEPEVCFDYEILHEDSELLVVNKPAHLPVHPAGRYFFHTLLVHLQTNGFKTPLLADRQYYLAHRIDKETSGVLLLAKNPATCDQITKLFANRKVAKTYLAIVQGHPKETEFECALSLGRSLTSPVKLKMDVVSKSQDGLPALTRFRVIQRFANSHGNFSLIECFPKTGRQHQIRVHLAHLGFPIIGDKLYSISEEEALRFYHPDRPLSRTTPFISAELQSKLILDRQALHAASIEFNGRRFEAPLPRDLSSFLDL